MPIIQLSLTLLITGLLIIAGISFWSTHIEYARLQTEKECVLYPVCWRNDGTSMSRWSVVSETAKTLIFEYDASGQSNKTERLLGDLGGRKVAGTKTFVFAHQWPPNNHIDANFRRIIGGGYIP